MPKIPYFRQNRFFRNFQVICSPISCSFCCYSDLERYFRHFRVSNFDRSEKKEGLGPTVREKNLFVFSFSLGRDNDLLGTIVEVLTNVFAVDSGVEGALDAWASALVSGEVKVELVLGDRVVGTWGTRGQKEVALVHFGTRLQDARRDGAGAVHSVVAKVNWHVGGALSRRVVAKYGVARQFSIARDGLWDGRVRKVALGPVGVAAEESVRSFRTARALVDSSDCYLVPLSTAIWRRRVVGNCAGSVIARVVNRKSKTSLTVVASVSAVSRREVSRTGLTFPDQSVEHARVVSFEGIGEMEGLRETDEANDAQGE